MTKIIVNADDFGYTEGLNYGVIEAHKKGIVTSCTVMANMPGFEHGMELLKANPTLRAGVHLTLSCYKPLLKNHKTIVDSNGNFYKKLNEEIAEKVDLEEVYSEFCAQIDRVKGHIEITHLDSHHHAHSMEFLKPVMERIHEKYNLPMRQAFHSKIEGVKYVPVFIGFYGENATADFFKNNIDKLKEYEIVDIMCHPAYLDSFLLGNTSYAMERAREQRILSDNNLKEFLQSEGMELVNYSIFK